MLYCLFQCTRYGGLLGGKFIEFLLACLVDFVVCLIHSLLLISMHCGLLGGEFIEVSSFGQTFVSC